MLLILPGFYNVLTVTRFTVSDPRFTRPVRIALITDLHSCAYGDGMKELLDAVDRESPDLVLLGGDIFDDELPDGNAVAFLRGAAERYPVYYVTGNHEYMGGEAVFRERMALLEEIGVVRLGGASVTLDIGGAVLRLCGVDDPSAWTSFTEKPGGSFRRQVAKVAGQAGDGIYTILLAHRPETIGVYAKYDFDLVLAGHAHGGQWRVPGVLNGLWAPNQGLLPACAGGLYERNGTLMIVSRGLARESTPLPRFYNRPEVVIIDLKN